MHSSGNNSPNVVVISLSEAQYCVQKAAKAVRTSATKNKKQYGSCALFSHLKTEKNFGPESFTVVTNEADAEHSNVFHAFLESPISSGLCDLRSPPFIRSETARPVVVAEAHSTQWGSKPDSPTTCQLPQLNLSDDSFQQIILGEIEIKPETWAPATQDVGEIMFLWMPGNRIHPENDNVSRSLRGNR